MNAMNETGKYDFYTNSRSCIAHLSAQDTLRSVVIEEQKF